MGRRDGRRFVAAAARLAEVSSLLAEGAVVIIVDVNAIPHVAHNLDNRADLAPLLRTVADGLESAPGLGIGPGPGDG